MSKLAIAGGEPVRSPLRSWPTWPPVTERAVELVTTVVRSGKWAYDGPMERRFAQAFAVCSAGVGLTWYLNVRSARY